MKHRLLVSIALVLALVTAACGGSDDVQQQASDETEAVAADPTVEPEPDPTETPEPTAEPEPTDVPEAPVEEVEADTVAATAASECGSGTTPGTTGQSFEFDGIERTYQQLLPTSYDDSTDLPVVLNFHGLGSTGVEQLGFSDYAAVAEAEGFIVIAPTGLPGTGDGRNSWEVSQDQEVDRDDLAFANALLDLVTASLCVDETRVYTTGMSNGGYFSSVLVCEMSDRIAAAASVAALTHADDCDPERTVPYIGFHGTDDDVVPYNGGGESSLAPGQIVPLFELKILEEFGEFAVAAGCDPEPTILDFSANVTEFEFSNCNDDVEMTFYEIANGGHTWPGSGISLALSEALGLGVTTSEISATQVSWDFFEQYSLSDS